MSFSRRLALIFLSLAAILVLAAGFAFLYRNQIVESIAIRQLAARGVEAQLTVTDVGFGGIDIVDLSVEELRIGHIALTYTLSELLTGRVRVADIENLEMTLDLTGENPPLGGLQSFFPESAEEADEANAEAAAAEPLPLPAVSVSNARLIVLIPNREIHLLANGGLSPSEDGASELMLGFEGESGPLRAEGNIAATLLGTVIGAFDIDALLRDDANAVSLSLNLSTDSLSAEQPEMDFRVEGHGTLEALADHAALGEALRPQGGTFQLDADGTAQIPLSTEGFLEAIEGDARYALTIDAGVPPSIAALPEWTLEPFDADVNGTISLRDAVFQATTNAHVDYTESETTFDFSAGETRFVLNDDFTLRSLDLNDFTANGNAVPTPFGLLQSAALDARIVGLPTAPSGPLHLRATSPGIEIASVTASNAAIEANLTLAPTEDGFRFDLSAPAQVSIGALHLPAILPLQNVRAQILSAQLDIVEGETGFAFTQTARVSVPALSLRIERQDAAPTLFELSGQTFAIQSNGSAEQPVRFTASTNLERFSLPDFGMVVSGQAVNVTGTIGGEIRAHVAGGTVLQQGDAPLFEPLVPDITMIQDGDRLVFSGALRGAGDSLNVVVDGSHSIEAARGVITFTVDELLFGPEDAEGTALSQLLASMEDLRGRVNGEARFGWSADGVESSGRLAVIDLSFERSGMTVEGLNTELVLDRLLPAHSPPGQRLTIRRIDTGIEVTALQLGYAVEETEDGSPRVTAQSLTMNVAGGRITAEGGTIDPTLGAAVIPLRAEELDLSQLLALIGLDELTGEGRLSGLIPLRHDATGIAIEGANLGATSEGIISYRSESARDALASGGDAVTLLLDALEDFHYSGLDMSLNKPIAGDTQITLRLQGNNPTLLEGHPFDLNISLTGNADPLLEALTIGRTMSNDFLRSITGQ